MTQHAAKAHQGHLYKYGESKVIAMQSGVVVEVREVNDDEPCPLGKASTVKASWLTPLPMRYYHGETP